MTNMAGNSGAGANLGSRGAAHNALLASAAIAGKWEVVCRDKHGKIKWIDEIENLVVNEGLNQLLSAALAGGSQITTWYLGLMDASPTVAAGDTMASHAGWAEVDDYTQANRPTWTPGSVTGQSVDNSAAAAEFTMDDTVTVGGAFLTSNNTKNGTTGELYAAGAFAGGNRPLQSSDTLEVTATFTTEAAA